ncbi:RING-type domain-containing protein [Aphelenchoides fujianensis]|nr:RING-type domain-containing protein [Aphelenchoides fujianensis]
MAIYRAEHGEILRGSRKDDEFLLTFRSQFSELIKKEYYRKKTVADRTPIGRIVASALLRQLSFSTLRNVHWAIFFLSTGTFYSLWKRAVGIKYVTIRPQTNTKIAILFKIIGVTVLLQYVLKFVLAVRYDVLKSMRRQPWTPNPGRRQSTRTPCGHLYCYGCILFHSEHSGLEPDLGQCPQCRFQFELRCLIPILNL